MHAAMLCGRYSLHDTTRELPMMKELLKLLRGARLIAKGQDSGRTVYHWLLPDGRVVEVVR